MLDVLVSTSIRDISKDLIAKRVEISFMLEKNSFRKENNYYKGKRILSNQINYV